MIYCVHIFSWIYGIYAKGKALRGCAGAALRGNAGISATDCEHRDTVMLAVGASSADYLVLNCLQTLPHAIAIITATGAAAGQHRLLAEHDSG